MLPFDHLIPRQPPPGSITVDDVIVSFLRGELDPYAELWGPAGQTTVWSAIAAENRRTSDGWIVNRAEQTAASALWSILAPGERIRWLCGSYSLDQLRQMVDVGEAHAGTDVVLDQRGAKSIPLEWLLLLPVPIAPMPKKEIPWGKIALGVGALFAAGWAIKKITEDPEPRAIREIAEEMEDEGAEVFADVRGYPRPPVMNGRIADVVGYHEDGTIEIVEVENDRSIDRPHGRAQIADLALWASRSHRRSFQVEVVDGGRDGRA